MQIILLIGFSAAYALFVWHWLRDWRRGEISRSPTFATVLRAKTPQRFWIWTAVHGSILALAGGMLVLAWSALVTGDLK